MKIEIERRDYSWKIKVNNEYFGTVWMEHRDVRPEDREVMNTLLQRLNTDNSVEKT